MTAPPKPPPWLRVRLPFATPDNNPIAETRSHVTQGRLHTVCEEASCPNLGHCWGQGTATFLIMGDRCTRRCNFCDINTARPLPLDPEEPARLARTVADLKLKHVVITSVDRDELKDCGSAHFAAAIRAVRQRTPEVSIEVLIPDFKGVGENLQHIWDAQPDIVNHNVETVPALFKTICPQSNYEVSLSVLRAATDAGFLTKSGIILGLGETREQVEAVIVDLRAAGVALLTLGQYMQPSPAHATVERYVSLEEFRQLKESALEMGFSHVESGPLVRSSYHASDALEQIRARLGGSKRPK